MSFPKDPDGDVIIKLGDESPDDELQLKSAILSTFSSFFKASLDPKWADNENRSETETDACGVPKKHYSLEYDSDLGFWVITTPKAVSQQSKDEESNEDEGPTIPGLPGCKRKRGGKADPADYHIATAAYKTIFAWMYHAKEEEMWGFENRRAMHICLALDFLQVSQGVCDKLSTLITRRCRVSENPGIFLHIATQLQSPYFYREAFKHAVGLGDSLEEDDVAYIRNNEDLRQAVESGSLALEERRIRTWERLWGIQAHSWHASLDYNVETDSIAVDVRLAFLNHASSKLDLQHKACRRGAASAYLDLYQLQPLELEYMTARRLAASHDISDPSLRSTIENFANNIIKTMKEILEPLLSGNKLDDHGWDATKSTKQAYFQCIKPSTFPWEKNFLLERDFWGPRLFQ